MNYFISKGMSRDTGVHAYCVNTTVTQVVCRRSRLRRPGVKRASPHSPSVPPQTARKQLPWSGKQPRAAPGGSVAPTGMVGQTPPVAAQAMLTVLSMLPKDSKLGYRTADGFSRATELEHLASSARSCRESCSSGHCDPPARCTPPLFRVAPRPMA